MKTDAFDFGIKVSGVNLALYLLAITMFVYSTAIGPRLLPEHQSQPKIATFHQK